MLHHPQYMTTGLAPSAFYGLQQPMYRAFGNTGFEDLASSSTQQDSFNKTASIGGFGNKQDYYNKGFNPFWPPGPSFGTSSLPLSTLAEPTTSDPSSDIINKVANTNATKVPNDNLQNDGIKTNIKPKIKTEKKKADDFKIDMPRTITCS